MADRRYYVLLNPRSGSALELGLTEARLARMMKEAGHDAVVDGDDQVPLKERIAAALSSPAEIVVAAGGDGTTTAIAEALVDSDKTLAILPLGTANLLARDLSVPLDLKHWLAALGGMETRLIDVGIANGRVFLHKVVIGLVPGIAAGREAIRGRDDMGAWLGFLRYLMRRIWRSRRLAVEIRPDNGPPRIVRVQALAVANNAYEEGFAHFFSRSRLDAGVLTLYILKHLSYGDLLRLLIGQFLGRWRNDAALGIETVKAVTVRSRKSAQNAMLDGEVVTLDVPMQFSVRPRALKVLAPEPGGPSTRRSDE
jgi:diacylglycerol kinase family enzyme